MEASDGQSDGRIEGDAYSVKPSQGLKPAEHLHSHMADVLDRRTAGAAERGTESTDPNPDSAFSTDVVEKCPAPKQIHSFYFVKIRHYEDQEMKAEIQLAENDIRWKNQEYVQLTKELKWARLNRGMLNYKSWPLHQEDWQYQKKSQSKMRELRMLYAALAKSHPSNIKGKKSESLCSSEEELNCLVKGLSLRIQHESHTSVKERQLLREIKLLEGTREQFIANSSPKEEAQVPLASKNKIQRHVQMICVDLARVSKRRLRIQRKFESLDDEKTRMDKEIRFLEKEVVALNQKRAAIYSKLLELRKECEEGDALFHQNQAFLNFTKKFAARKDIASLRELSHLQVEKFMQRLNRDKAFRDGYKKRILPSLVSRQLSRDGRMQGPVDEPLVSEEVTSLELKKPLVKSRIEATREEVISSPKLCSISANEVHKEGIVKSTRTEVAVTRNVRKDSKHSSVVDKLSRKWNYCTMVSIAQMLEAYIWGIN